MCKSLRLAYVAKIYDTINFKNKGQLFNDLLKMELKSCENIILTGPPGTGKSRLAKRLGRRACKNRV